MNKKITFFVFGSIGIVLMVSGILFLSSNTSKKYTDTANTIPLITETAGKKDTVVIENLPDDRDAIVDEPIRNARVRVTKKPFGIKITPDTSPVYPEKFSGYHTGVDFETFPEEANGDVDIFAICAGALISKRQATGYGGVIVQQCDIRDVPVTVIYGHLDVTSIAKKGGDHLDGGEKIGVLGQGFSYETDGERKHLHLGIHRGNDINLLGYTQTSQNLVNWIDFLSLLRD